MKDVDIISQLRAWRDDFAKSHDYDVHAMAASLRKLDYGQRKLIRGEPRRPVQTRGTSQALQSIGLGTSVSEHPGVAEPASGGS